MRLEQMLHRVAQRPRRVRFSFDDGAGNRPAKPSGLGIVSRLQHAAASATDARYSPGAACFVAGSELCRRADRRLARHRHRHGPVAPVVWNTRKIHFSRNWKTAAAKPSVKADRREPRSGRSEAQSLYGRRSGGYARERAGIALVSASILSFQHVYAAATLVTAPVTAPMLIFLLAADSARVDACKHVNASVYAVARCMMLIAFTFPHSYRPVSRQQPFGGDVSLPSRRRRRRAFAGSASAPGRVLMSHQMRNLNRETLESRL